ncbi:hypothetical protein Pmani_004500 [Petrolisthes manimaculis]|uniref:Ig-like domain-containing protein n=1 Tax=Petrolisthes manimaculis TaxID=1843537 RepID=A0AAE1QEQ6_9EUCA|nr:hypothetical protein Pmani_004500 [Petrolisthes manimaculis]
MLLTNKGLSNAYYDHYDNYYFDAIDERDDRSPTFQARSQIFTVEVGQSVIIPCDVDNVGNNKLIIKKIPPNGAKEKLLSVGREKVTRDRRITVEGARMTISHARPRDAGDYLCEFDLEPPVQLKHRLDVQFAPTIKALVPPEQRVIKGTAVSLQCKSHGNPEPIIRWSRQEGPLPSGLTSEEGHTLTLQSIDRHVEGTYLCTADNGIGDSASAAMTITVEYPPEITTEKAVVRSGEGDEVELTQHMSLIHVSHRHTLTIRNVTEKDFGAYVCIAENVHGQKDAVIQMTGLPKPPVVSSSPNGGERTAYTLTWQTETYYPITEYMVKFREARVGVWQVRERVSREMEERIRNRKSRGESNRVHDETHQHASHAPSPGAGLGLPGRDSGPE